MEALTAIPEAFAAGTTVKYTRSYSAYPASAGWTAKLLLAGARLLTVDAAASGNAFAFTLAADETATLAQGNYHWREIVEKSGEKYVADSGTVKVEPNIEAALAGDLQSFEERQLAVVEAALEGRLTTDTESYQIAGRAVVKIPVHELMKIRAQLISAIRAQGSQGRMGPRVRVQFSSGEGCG